MCIVILQWSSTSYFIFTPSPDENPGYAVDINLLQYKFCLLAVASSGSVSRLISGSWDQSNLIYFFRSQCKVYTIRCSLLHTGLSVCVSVGREREEQCKNS